MDRRFVIQFHDAPDGAHYDLMLEDGPGLATWRLPAMPAADPIAAERLGDHRLAYLTYEGPVSGGRGRVRIAEAGTFVLLDRREDLWRIELSGRALRGRFVLTRRGGSHWQLAAEADPPGRSEASADRR